MLSENFKELGQNLVDLTELKIEALRKSLPNRQQTLNELEDAHKQEKPKHLTNEQWQKWLETGKRISENFVRSY